MKKKQNYTSEYYSSIEPTTESSAQELIPILLKYFQPQSVVDVGCGTGIWLHFWQKNGIKEYLGIDGEYVLKTKIVIPKKNFLSLNLEENFLLNKRFDLVISLEVAEHLKETSAKSFIRSLIKLGDIILFSAAIPGQGGLNHINEQFPEYWVEIFKEFDYYPFDCIRKEIWLNSKIDVCYRQNILFYIKKEAVDNYPLITTNQSHYLTIIHPTYYKEKIDLISNLNQTLKNPIKIIKYYIKALLKRFVNKK